MKRIEKYITQYGNAEGPLIINYKRCDFDTEGFCDSIGLDGDVIDVASFIEEEIIPVVKGEKQYAPMGDITAYPKLCILERFDAILGKETTAQELFLVLSREFHIVIIKDLGRSYQIPFTHGTYIDEYDGGISLCSK